MRYTWIPKHNVTYSKNEYLNVIESIWYTSTLSLPLKVQCISLLVDLGLGHLIYFGQWSISRYQEIRSLNCACMLGLFLCLSHCHKRNLGRFFFTGPKRIRDMWNWAAPKCAMLPSFNHPGMGTIINYCHFKSLSLELHCYTDIEIVMDKWGAVIIYTFRIGKW